MKKYRVSYGFDGNDGGDYLYFDTVEEVEADIEETREDYKAEGGTTLTVYVDTLVDGEYETNEAMTQSIIV